MRGSLGFIPAKEFVVGVALVLALLVLPSGVRANTITIGVSQDGIAGVLQTAGNGSASFAGLTYGAFTLNLASGIGSPILTEPSLLITSLNAQANSAGVLHVFITEQYLILTGVNSFISSFASNLLIGGATSVVEQTFVDASNGLFGGTQLASSTFTGLGSNSSSDSAPSLDGGFYSVTVEYTITATGAGNVNDTINLNLGSSTVPEPSALLLTGFGLGGLLLFAKRRLTKASGRLGRA